MARTVSIRGSLTTHLVGFVLLLGVALTAASGYGVRRVVARLSRSLMNQDIERTAERLRLFFEPVERALRLMGTRGEPSSQREAEMERMGREAAAALRHLPQVLAIRVVDEAGLERRWTRAASEPAVGKARPATPWSGTNGTDGASESGHVIDEAPVRWSEVGELMGSGVPGLTVSLEAPAKGGASLRLAMDVPIDAISDFTTRLVSAERGMVLVMTKDLQVIGLPQHPRYVDPAKRRALLMKTPDQLDHPLAQAASRAFEERPRSDREPVRFQSQGEAWWGQSLPYRLGAGRELWIAAVVPEDELLGELTYVRTAILGITAVVLLAGLLRARLLARRFSVPIEGLVAESDRISAGDLAHGAEIHTPVREFQSLAAAHDRMRAALRLLMKIEDDLELARQVQQSTFPQRLPRLPGFQLHAYSEPADATGGDTYDVIGLVRDVARAEALRAAGSPGAGLQTGADGAGPVRRFSDLGPLLLTEDESEHAVLLLADATGHGIGPALSVTQLRAMLRMSVRMGAFPMEALRHINEQLHADLPRGRFITAWMGLLDSARGTLLTFSAGQGPLLHYHAAEDRFERFNADGPPLGVLPQVQFEAAVARVLAPGDIYAVISDGVYEAEDTRRVAFGADRVEAVIRAHRHEPPQAILEALREAVRAFCGPAPIQDDRTAILIRRA